MTGTGRCRCGRRSTYVDSDGAPLATPVCVYCFKATCVCFPLADEDLAERIRVETGERPAPQE